MTTTDVFCGSLGRATPANTPGHRIILMGTGANAVLNLDHLCRPLVRNVPSHFHDLLEIAAYVYVADQMTNRRGKGHEGDYGKLWRRQFHFSVPVRSPDFWNQQEVMDALVEAVGFLSDDEYEFTFSQDQQPTPYQQYIQFQDRAPWEQADDVVLFSGGLDSLAGVVEQILTHRQRLVLVTHASSNKFETWHATLRAQINQRAGDIHPQYVKVTAHKLIDTEEYTQRSRSFLYASLACTIANMTGKKRIRFFENGVTSLNLPISGQIIGSRATRTTHPETLRRFAKFFSLLANEQFVVENPFQWFTKTDIVGIIVSLGCQSMIENATSCAHTWRMPRQISHCGTCSQCVDRRLATIAANAKDHDPQRLYRKNLFTSALNDEGVNKDRTLAGSYALTALTWEKMTESELFISEGDIGQALAAMPGSATENARKIVDLLHRHARAVKSAIAAGIADYRDNLTDRVAIDADSFLYMILGREHGEPDQQTIRPLSSSPEQRVLPNWFRPADKNFYVMLNGNGPHEIKNIIGAQMLHWLLQRPRIPVSCRDIASHLYEQCPKLLKGSDHRKYQRAVQVINEYEGEVNAWEDQQKEHEDESSESGGIEMKVEVITDEQLSIVEKSIKERREELADGPAAKRKAIILDEIEKLETYRKRATMPGRPNKPKSVNAAQLRLQKSLWNALQTVLKALHGADPALAKYLNSPAKGGHISTGYLMTFLQPPDAGEWDLTSTSLKKLMGNGSVAS